MAILLKTVTVNNYKQIMDHKNENIRVYYCIIVIFLAAMKEAKYGIWICGTQISHCWKPNQENLEMWRWLWAMAKYCHSGLRDEYF